VDIVFTGTGNIKPASHGILAVGELFKFTLSIIMLVSSKIFTGYVSPLNIPI
jgi:hypothetical protein